MNKKEIEIHIESIKKHGLKGRGKSPLIKHLNGEALSRKQAMDAKCYDCMCYFQDGMNDCSCKLCPLYPFMPFSKNKKVNIKKKSGKKII